jgi:HEAT repeat protein
MASPKLIEFLVRGAYVKFAIGLFCFAAVVCAQPPLTQEVIHANNMLATASVDKNPDTRKEAAAALGLAGANEPYTTEIGSLVEDKDLYVRLAALQSLVDVRKKDAIPALNKALYDETPEVSFAAAKALWSLNDPAGRGALLGVVSGENKAASSAMTAKKRDMVRLLHTPHGLMMFVFQTGVGFAPVPGLGEGMSSLTMILTDSGVSGRAAALLLLSTERSPEVLQAIREGFKDKDVSVRSAAVHAMAVRDDPAYMEELLPLMDDPKEAVKLRAAAGYVRLATIKARPVPVQTKGKAAPKGAAPAAKAAAPAPANKGK